MGYIWDNSKNPGLLFFKGALIFAGDFEVWGVIRFHSKPFRTFFGGVLCEMKKLSRTDVKQLTTCAAEKENVSALLVTV